LRKAIEDVNSGVLLGASAQSAGNVSEQSIEEVTQSTVEKESEIGNKTDKNKNHFYYWINQYSVLCYFLLLVVSRNPDTEKSDSLTTASSRHVKFTFLRRLSVSLGAEMTDINVSEGRSNSPVTNSRSDNQP